jgi:hypothetical protein
MRLARPVLIPPRQGFQVVAILSPIGQTVGASIIEQLNGLVSDNSPSGSIGQNAPTTDAGYGPAVNGVGVPGTGLSVQGSDDIEKDIKYLIDGIHSRDVL